MKPWVLRLLCLTCTLLGKAEAQSLPPGEPPIDPAHAAAIAQLREACAANPTYQTKGLREVCCADGSDSELHFVSICGLLQGKDLNERAKDECGKHQSVPVACGS